MKSMTKHWGLERDVFSFLGVVAAVCSFFTLLTHPCLAENNFKNLYELARADKWDMVIKIASDVLKESPQVAESDELIKLMAQAYYEVGEYERAGEEAQKLWQRELDRGVGLFLVECMIRAGKPQEAVGIIEEMGKVYGWDGELFYWMGEALFAQRLLGEAEEYFRKAWAEGDSRIKGWAAYSLAYTLFEEGRLEEALEIALRTAREELGKMPGEQAKLLGGEILIREGKYDDALKILEGTENAGLLRVKAYVGKGEITQAIDTAEEEGILLQTAEMFEEGKKYSEAGECLERAGEEGFYARIVRDYLLYGSAGDAVRVCGKMGKAGKAIAGWIYYLLLGDTQAAGSAFAGAGDEELGILGRACIAYERRDWQSLAKALEALKDTPLWNEKAETLLALAYLRIGDYGRAIEEAQALSDEEIKNLILGEAYYRQGDFTEALGAFRKALGEEAKYGEGWALLRLGRIDEAISVFENIKGHRAREADLACGYALWRTGRGEEAVEYLLKAETEKRLRGMALWIKARAFEDEGKFDETGRIYDDLVGEGYLAEDALIKGAEMRMLSGAYEEGLGKYREFLSKYPASKYRYYAIMGIGWGLMKLGRFEEAKEAFAQVWGELRREALFREGVCLLMSGDKEGASVKFAECIKLGMDGTLIDWLGKFYFDEKRFDEIVEMADYGGQKVKLLAGWACLERGEYAEAEKFLKALLDSELCGEAGMGLYYLYRALGRVEDGVKVLLEVEGKIAGEVKRWVELSLGEAFLGMGENRLALAHLREACGEEKDLVDAVAHFLIGKLYEQVRNFRGALSEYLDVYYLSTEREWRLISGLRAGIVYEKMGELDKASSIYAGVAKLDPTGLYGAQARERLQMLAR